MALTTEQRKQVWADQMSKMGQRRELYGNLNKSQLLAAVNAIDQWIDDYQVSFNTAIPEPAKTELTSKQKAELFMLITALRWGVM